MSKVLFCVKGVGEIGTCCGLSGKNDSFRAFCLVAIHSVCPVSMYC